MRQSHKAIAGWCGLVVMFYLVFTMVKSNVAEEARVGFSQFLQEVDSGALTHKDVTIRNESEFVWMEGKVRKCSTGKFTDEVLHQLRAKEVNFTLANEESSVLWQALLGTALPLLVILGFFYFITRQIQSGGGKAMSFGKSKARAFNEASPKTTFKSVAGVEEAKEELQEIVEFLKDPKKFTRLGGRIPKGVLLMGPPGTGKTLLAKAIAGEAGVPFFSISGSDFVEMFVGVGASRVRDLFEQSKKHAPCIIFIDEIDAVGRHRGAGLGGGHDEREQTLNQLLVEMDGFESNEGVILIAATNRPDVLDPALLRPGRFDRRVVVPRPDMLGRGEVLKVHTKTVPLAEDVDFNIIARGTPGFSGADLSNLVNEAALGAAREGKAQVNQHDFDQAKDKVLMGAERRSMIVSEKEKLITAYHEAGHAVVGKLIPGNDPVHKVTIIPRGRALGVTQTLPQEDQYTQSKTNAMGRLAMLFGGRIAEELQFGEITSGAGNDMQVATGLARQMVCEWGMSEKLGPVTFGKKDEQMFFGREMGQAPDYSQATAVTIDSEVRAFVDSAYARAKEVLSEHLAGLRRVAGALIDYETIDGEEVSLLLDGKAMTREPPKVRMPSREDMERRAKERDAQAPDKEKKGKDDGRQLLGPLAGQPTPAR